MFLARSHQISEVYPNKRSLAQARHKSQIIEVLRMLGERLRIGLSADRQTALFLKFVTFENHQAVSS